MFLTESIDGVDRLFGLDLQLLVDAGIQLLAILVLFIGLSYLLFNPVRELLRKRQETIKKEMEDAAKDKEDAAKLRKDYEAKMRDVSKESEAILSETRKKALKKETEIVNEAREEAGRIMDRANREIELEKSKVRDEVKKEMIAVASAMAGRIVTASMDEAKQNELIEDTLKEMGDETWQN
ncbi:MAG: F0F1 ATP synthase subunit B [Lachnospiraceae bacterium]|nr:F0F1 ATP synthase subunit B [Lachnospiraceae bacterium]